MAHSGLGKPSAAQLDSAELGGVEGCDGQGMDPHAIPGVFHGVWGEQGLVKVPSDPLLSGGSTHTNSVRSGGE